MAYYEKNKGLLEKMFKEPSASFAYNERTQSWKFTEAWWFTLFSFVAGFALLLFGLAFPVFQGYYYSMGVIITIGSLTLSDRYALRACLKRNCLIKD
jgi:hypothetical protein